MVAVVSGNGLGLFNTSLTGLGGLQGGPAGLGGRAGAQVVNITNGNLILQDQDENLSIRGFNTGVFRTYNSRGTVAGAGQDGFVTGYERRVALTSGTLNAAASQMTLTTGDGQTQVFTYSSANTYTSTAGDGAHDTLVWNSGTSTWTMTEGSSRREEQYANHANTGLLGRLTRIRDLKSDGITPAQFDVIYSDNTATARITEIRSIDDQATVALRDAILFSYDASNRLSSITTREGGISKSQVSYGYDTSGRLSWVQQDLTPTIAGDATWDQVTLANNNNLRFRTTYTYVSAVPSTDLLIASVTQSDGATVAYTYEADGGGGFRVKTVTQGSASDGSAQTVTFTYNANSTDVLDSLNRTWTYQYDANKQLTAILAPAIGGQRDTTTYAYDTSGNVTQVKTVSGAITLSQTDQSFDTKGNVLWQWTRVAGANASSIAVQRTYSSSNQLLTETRFTGLDTDGPVATQSPSGGLTTNFIYDAQNRLRFSVDATGAVTERTYATTGNGIGQMASSRVYFGAVYAATMSESALTTWATATQKGSSQLTEFTYDVKGRLQQSVSFASVNPSTGVGVTTDVANDITSYSYDAQGLLLQKILIRGATRTTTYTTTPLAGSEVSSYVYDGMGRLLSVITRNASTAAQVANPTAQQILDFDNATVSTTYAYTDSLRQIVVTLDSGATRTETRNLAGQTTTMALAGSGQTTRTTQNFFDGAGQLRGSQDASGARRYFFYDDKGRLNGEVDATGAVTQYIYDGADRRLSTVQYANRVTTTSWLSGGTVTVAKFVAIGVIADSANDRSSVNTFDAAGRVLTTTDGDAANTNRQITTYTYDGAGRVTLARTTDSVGTAATARETRQVYDNAGRVLAKVDAQNFVTEYTYDGAGRLVRSTVYANASTSPTSIVLGTLRPTLNAANDQTTRYFYNGRGQQIGTLDAQGYLTEAIVDEAGNTRAERRYAKQLTGLTGTENFAALKTATTVTLPLPTELYRESKSAYNGLGQLITQTNYENTVTRFTYDETGRLVRTQAAEATTEVREGFKRYNVFDELIGEISGEQVARAEAALGGPLSTLNESQLTTAYNDFGVTHSYDAMSRHIESIGPQVKDAQGIYVPGNKTFYFYDSQGNQTFVVKGVAQDNAGVTGVQNSYGEVTETRYSAFGQVVHSMAYTGRIVIPVPGDRASIESTINTFRLVTDFTGNTIDTRRQFVYDQRGMLKETINALNKKTTYSYTAFGQLNQEIRFVGDAATSLTIQRNYDKRGLETSRTDAVGAGAGITRVSSQTYDAFGRVTSSTDARGAITNVTYDRLGRQITRSLNVTSEGTLRTETTTMAYDAFSQTVSMTDALNNTTNYVYSDVNRSLRVTSQEGVAVTTTHNRFGQTATVSQVLPDATTATTTYTYNKDGFLLSITNPLGQTTSRTPDLRGLLYETIDASGRKVRYTYDAVGRVLTRSEDPAGLNLITTTSYDGQGRQVKVTDASGRITTMSYDQEGRLLQTTQDPSGLNLRTGYTYDAAGRQIDMIEGVGTSSIKTTRYVYDVLGRRIQDRVDPNGLNLITNYLYDANDNVVQRTDATGNVARFVYDEANRRVYDINATGGVSKTTYDKNGQVIAARSYATAIVVSDLSTTVGVTADAIKNKVNLVANEAIDQISYRVYDRDSRVRFSVTHLSSTTASVTEMRYDKVGRVSQTLAYTNAITVSAALKTKLQSGDVSASTDINTLLQSPITTTWASSFNGNSLAGFSTSAGIAPTVSNNQVVFDRNPGVSGSYAYPVIVSNTRHTLSEGLTFSAEFSTQNDLTNTSMELGFNNEIAWLQPGYRREGISINNGKLYRRQINGNDNQNVEVMTLSANTTYVVEIETRDGLITTYVYAKDTDRSKGINFSASSSSASFGSSYWYAAGLHLPGVSGGSIILDNVSATTRQSSQAQANRYDAAGRLTQSHDALGNVTQFRYDAAGRRISVTDARGNSSYVVYDGAGRAKYSIDPTGAVIEQRYDAAGRVTETLRYTQAITLSTALIAKLQTGDATSLADINALLKLPTAITWASTIDSNAFTGFTNLGLNFPVFNNGEAEFKRDPSATINRATALVAETRSYLSDALTYSSEIRVGGSLSGSMLLMGIQNEADYLSAGYLRDAIYVDNGVLYTHQITGATVTKTPLLTLTLNTTYVVETETATDHITTFVYVKGSDRSTGVSYSRQTDSISYGRTMWYAYNEQTPGVSGGSVYLDNVSAGVRQNPQQQSIVYDAAGRAKYSIDAFGAVTESVFDAAGRVIAQRMYATVLAIDLALRGKLDRGIAAPSDIVIAIDNSRDRQSYVVYDTAGRQRFSVDALGNVSETRYDAAGRVAEALSYLTALSSADLNTVRGGTATLSTFTSFVTTNSSAARASTMVYDAAGRMVYTLTRSDASANPQLAVVSERRYNALGQVLADVSYGITIAYSAGSSAANVTTAINGSSNQRITRYAYDTDGRLRFTVNNGGEVSEQRYNALGQVTQSLRYSQTIASSATTEAAIAAAVVGQTNIRTSTNTYDVVGRLSTSTDALNGVESYTYNATGQVLTRTNKLGNVWNYSYDAAGRQIEERSPSVNVAHFVNDVLTIEAKSVVTRTTYDAVGNVVSRTENAEAVEPLERRITRYQYDSRGNQIKTIFPDAYKIDSVTNQLVALGTTPTTEVTYNALNQAVVQKDVRGNYTYKTYDSLGRVAYDIDAEGYVTSYSYNSYSEQIGLTRFAAKLVTTGTAFVNASWLAGKAMTSAQVQAGVSAIDPNNRGLTTTYDSRGFKTQVIQSSVAYYSNLGVASGSASPTTQYQYDAYGQLVKEAVQLDATTWANTFHYYDLLGRKTISVDAEGYVTKTVYNALGEVVSSTEYARAIDYRNLSATTVPVMPLAGDAASGYDRITRYSYDSLGRKISETSARHYQASNGSQMVRDVMTALAYDAEGQLLTTTVDGVLNSTLTYDALGRTSSVQETVRDVLRTDAESQLLLSAAKDLSSAALYEQASPYTTMEYDAFGNSIRVMRYANGMRAGVATADASRDQTTATRYDYQGRAVMTVDAHGNRTYSIYDEADHVTSQWHTVRGSVSAMDAVVTQDFVYDKNGLQTDAFLKRKVGAATQTTERQQTAIYNAFGEIASKTIAGVAGTLTYNYNNVGNLISSNESGVLRSFGHTLAGVQVFEQRGSVDEVYRQSSDRLGRIVQMVLPSHTATVSIRTSVVRTLDRWGNVLLEVDPRGFSTQYEFNELNQKTVQRAPTVEVVAEDGTVRWLRPETRWLYDALGRQTAVRDANGKVDQMIYDAAGRLMRSVDGTGAVTQMAYDALGNAQMNQNPIGYLTYQSFDKLGRVVSMGDYLPDNVGTARNKTVLQQYTLSEDGQRVLVTDAMSQISKYDFDGEGKLIKSITAMGVQMNYAYDNAGNKISTADAFATQTWQYDIHGRVIDHKDLSNRDYDYVYSPNNGLLTSYTNQWGANSSTTYYSNGQVKRITEGANWYEYEYDANGNRTLEKTNTIDGGLQAVYQESRMSYDSNNRLSRVITKDLNAAGKVILDVRYGYDAVGNRRVAVADSGYGPGVIQPVSTNAAPNVIATLATQTVKAGIATQLRLSPSDIFLDPERDLLTYSATLSSGAALPAWLTFDTSQLLSTGELIFTTTTGSVAGQTAVVRLTANDGTNTKYLDFTITVANNAAPVVIGSAPVFNLITNRAFNYELPVTSYFSDINAGDVLSFSVDSVSPGASWLTIDASSPSALRLSGTPSAAGTYTMTVRATDGSGAFTTRTISLVVANNAAPVAQAALPIQNVMIGRDFEISRSLNQLFVDSNGDALTLTASLSDGSPLPAWMNLQVLNDTQPPTVRLVGQVPVNTAVQTLGVRLTATDLGGATASQIINVQLAADPGIFMMANPINPNTLSANATGNVWTYQIPASTFIAQNTTVPIIYAATGMPSWMSFNSATRTFSGTPAPVGSWTIGITATAGGQTLSTSIVVNTINALPGGGVTNQSITAGAVFSYQVPAFLDLNGDALSYAASVSPSGSGITFNPATRQFGGVPAAGSYTITLTVTDTNGGIVTKQLILTVAGANAAPTLTTALPDMSVFAGTSFGFSIASNFAGSGITYSAVRVGGTAFPAWLLFNTATGTFSGTPTGTANNVFEIIVTATNANGSVNDTFILTKEGAGSSLKTAKSALAPVGTLVQTVKATPVTTSLAYNFGSTTDPLRNYQFSWYTYDGENRTIVSNGKLVGNQIVLGASNGSYETRYDAAGNSTVGISTDGTLVYIGRSTYDLRSQLSTQFYRQVLGEAASSTVTTRNIYDNAGRLTERRGYYGKLTAHWTDAEGYTFAFIATGFLASVEQNVYDADGRLVTQTVKERTPNFGWQQGVGSALDRQITTVAIQMNDLSVLKYAKSTVNYSGGYDAAGRLNTYTFSQAAEGSYPAFTWTYSYTYQGRDNWLETAIGGTGTGSYKATTSTGTYDSYGRRLDVVETTKLSGQADLINKRYFAYDRDGGILQRRDGYLKNGTTWTQAEEVSGVLQNPTPQWIPAATWNSYTKAQREAVVASTKNQRFAYAKGQLLGSVTQAGTGLDARSRLTAYSNSDMGDTTAVVQDGETLQIIAQRIYGNESFWYVLASANAIDSNSQLVAGTTLKVPDVVVHKNDASTFRPYNAGEIIGPTAPSLPYIPPPKNNNCAMIIMVVVAVVVSVVTAGALSGVALGALGTVGSSVAATMAAGAIAGAASAAASMAVGSLMGVASFSWRGVAAGAITGALTAGIADKFGSVGEALKAGGTGYIKAAALAVGNQLAGYAGNKLAGVQGTTFSWKAIAAGAVGNMASAAVGNAFLDSKAGPVGKFGQQFLGNMAGGLVTGHARKAFGLDDKVNYGSIAADAFGNTLGSAIGGALSSLGSKSSQKQVDEELDAVISQQREQLLAAGFSQEQIDTLPRNGKEFREALLQNARDNKAQSMQVQLDAENDQYGFFNLSNDNAGWVKTAGVNGMSSEAQWTLGYSIDDNTGWGTAPTRQEILNQLSSNFHPLHKMEFAAGAFVGLVGAVYDDAKGVVDLALAVKPFVDEGIRELAIDRYSRALGDTSSERFMRNSDSLDKKFQLLTDLATNAPKILRDIPNSMLADVQRDFRAYRSSIRNEEYFDAGISAMLLTYKTVGLVLAGAGAVKAGVSVARNGMRVLRELGEVARGLSRDIEIPHTRGMPDFEGLPEPSRTKIAAPAALNLSEVEVLTLKQAKRLQGENRGLIFVAESSGGKPKGAFDFERGATGADILSERGAVPALRYDHPNPNGNMTNNFVKFDGVEENGLTLIDRKLSMTSKTDQIDDIRRAAAAIAQNKGAGFKLIYEFPNQSAATNALRIMREFNIRGIQVRVANP